MNYFGYIEFIIGLVTGIALWFLNDTKHNPYTRGYADGYKEAMKEMAERKEE